MRTIFRACAAALATLLLSGCLVSAQRLPAAQAIKPSEVITAAGGALPNLSVVSEEDRTLKIDETKFRLYPGKTGVIVEFIFDNFDATMYVYGYMTLKDGGMQLYVDQFDSVRAARSQSTADDRIKQVVPTLLNHARLAGKGPESVFVPRSMNDIEAFYLALIGAGLEPVKTVARG